MRWLERLDRRRLSLAGLALAVVCFVALNVFGALELRRHRLDLTEAGTFTLSSSTRELLRKIEEPLVLRFYVSRGVREASPLLGAYADRVHDLLAAYERESGGRIDVRLVDPQPFSPEEDRAMGFGLQAIPLEGGAGSGYLGIAGTNSTDDADVIPLLSPDREPLLEYDLTRLVHNLAHPDKPVAAVLSGLPLSADPAMGGRPWQIAEQLGQLYDVRWLGGEVKAFGEDVDLLLLIHPQDLSELTLYAIDQFVLRGGRVLAFLDPHSEAAAMRRRGPGGGPASSGLPRLLEAWGVELVEGKVAADPRWARQVQFPAGGRQQVVPYLPWLAVGPGGLAQDEPVTAELERLTFASAGILKEREGAATEFKPLVTTGREARTLDAAVLAAFPDPLALIRDHEPGGEALVLAARIAGEVGTAFPEPPEGTEVSGERLERSARPASIIVVADTDLLEDRAWLSTQSLFGRSVAMPVANNAGFVANATDFLAGSESLASLRSREVSFRPFTLVEEIRRAAEQEYRAKEQELLARLDELQQQLGSLEVSAGEDGAVLSPAQKEELEALRARLLETRRELRDVQLALRRDIESLRDRLRFLNIAAVPIMVALVALGLALVRRARMRRHVDAIA